MKIHGKPRCYQSKPGKRKTAKTHPRILEYRCGKEKIDVIMWARWPSYDFIFGVPAKGNPYFGEEAAFFQFRDTRRKEVYEGFYVDAVELKCIIKGFTKVQQYRRSNRGKA